MTIQLAILTAVLLFSCSSFVMTQTLVVYDPTIPAKASKLTLAEDRIFRTALPPVRAMLANDVCEEEVEVTGVARGTFTSSGSRQSVVFYQFCQTGNGLGRTGLVVIGGDSVAGNFVAPESGWAVALGRVADLDGNGLDELALAYSGGMHQGAGGVGVDLIEFVEGRPIGIGRYTAEQFSERSPYTGWKLTAKPGTSPVFYKQKFISNGNGKWRAAGAPAVTKLGKPYATYEPVR